MKLTIVFIILFLGQAMARSSAQPSVSLTVKKASLQRIFSMIEKQTSYKFLYNDDLIPPARIDLSIREMNLTSALDLVFRQLPLSYRILNSELILVGGKGNLDLPGPISGTVKSQSGEPLPGVSVAVKGTQIATATSINGEFTIQAPDNPTLVFSYVGFISREVVVGSETTLSVILLPSERDLDQVVVVGYGSQRRKDITSSIATVSAADIQKSTAIGVDQALQGRAPGVFVTNNSGQPGSGVQIRIRGTGSFFGSNEPLYVIDGIPVNNAQTGSDQGGQDRINGLAAINPNDIESLEILKDASAQAIYGARAANGVVLITTKKGKAGKTSVGLNTFTGFQRFSNFYDLLNGPQYTDLLNEAFEKFDLQNQGVRPLNPIPAVSTNWQDLIFQTGLTHSSTLSISGGTDKTKFYLSASYFNQKGVILNSGYNRATFRANIDQQIANSLKVGFNVFGSLGVNNRVRNNGSANFQDSYNGNSAYGPNIISSALVASPLYEPYTATGDYGRDTSGHSNSQNPVALATQANLRANIFRAIGNTYVDWQIIKGLTYRFNGGYDIRNEQENFYFPPVPNLYSSGRVTIGGYNERNYVLENYLTYSKTLGKHTFSILGGQSFQKSHAENYNAGVGGVSLPNNLTLGAGRLNLYAVNDIQEYSFSSLYSRFNYNYDDKYLLQLTYRRDGSSRFGPNNKYANFPAASVAWRLSNEEFLKQSPLINDLRLRVSYGVSGNAEIGNYDWRARLGANPGYLSAAGVNALTPVNQDYSWEQAQQFNTGVNLTMLNDRVTIVADYYRRKTKDLLLRIKLPQTSGFSDLFGNIGDIENRGFEFGVNTTNILTKKFTWKTALNVGFNKLEALKLADDEPIRTGPFGNAIVVRVGEPIGYYLYDLEPTVDPQTGKYRPVDQNKNGILNDSDLVYMGSPFPKHFGGFTNEFYYGNFDLSIFLQWSYGNKIYNSTRGFIENLSRGYNQTTAVLRRWRNPGDVTDIPVNGWDGSNNGIVGVNSRFLEDGSYLRLKNVQLGYTFKGNWLKRAAMENLRVYFTAQNLFTITNYSGYDPEVSGSTGNGVASSLAVGEDFGTYPQAKTYTVGINVSF